MGRWIPSRDWLLTAWAVAVTRRPVMVLVVCAVLTVLSAWVTVDRLKFRSDRSELIDPSLPWQERYAAFKAKFPRWDDAVVVVERGENAASREASERFIAALDARLQADARFAGTIAGFPRDSAPVSLLLSEPLARVKQVASELGQTGPVLASPTLGGLLGLSALGGTSMGPEQRAGLLGLMERAAAVGEGRGASVLGLDDPSVIQRLETRSGRLAMLLVPLGRAAARDAREIATFDRESGVNTTGKGVAALRAHLDAVRATPGLEGVRAGVTGVPVLESDETRLSMRDATLASTISLSLITILMLVAYRGFVVPIFAVVSLLAGMAWSFGWATLAVGHLQLLSVTFASLLLGLGIDVAIHFIARLELLHADHDHLAGAMAEAFRGVGPGILTASITVAAACGAMALTSFSGVAEMGIIAAGGMLLCTLSVMCALPAMFMLMPRPEDRLRSHDGGVSRPFMGRIGPAFHRRPWLVLGASMLVLTGLGWLGAGVRFDPDLLKLMPDGTESVVWQDRLEADDSKSVWHAVVVESDEASAREMTLKLRGLPLVDDVGGAGMLFQATEDLRAKRAVLAGLPDPSAMAPSPGAADDAAAGALRSSASSMAARWKEKDSALSAAAARVAALDASGLSRVQERYAQDRVSLAARISMLRGGAEATVGSLPPALRATMVGEDGSLLLRVYPKESERGESVLSPARLEPFASAVLAAAPTATGPTVQIYESTRLITGAYRQAAIWALVGIVALLLFDFASPLRGLRLGAGLADTLCALLPVGGGVVMMLAVMRLAGVSLNFANMIVMPLIIGIGVGCGVHAVRRWRLQPDDLPPGLAGGSGRAITLTTLTTVIGFAAMMTGRHRGIWSLGFVMSVGLVMVWVVTILVLPSVLAVRGRALGHRH